MRFDIEAYSRVGPIQFGMPRNEIRAVLNVKFEEFKKTQLAVTSTDDFLELGVHVYYTQSLLCEAIEMFDPAEPLFQAQPLIRRPFLELYEWFKMLDPDIESDDSGITSFKFGIALYAPSASKAPLEQVESVLAFANGYYN